MSKIFDNHNYLIHGGDQHCHICLEVEPTIRQPTGDERTDRAAAHMVHYVKGHLTITAEEWNRG